MFSLSFSLRLRAGLLACSTGLGLSLLSGCGLGVVDRGAIASADGQGSNNVVGKLYGGSNPISGATITLYTTTSGGYGATATQVATATTDSSGVFGFTLPTATIACPSGEYAYLGAVGGNTGGHTNNAVSVMMVPIGLCDANYTHTGSAGSYTNTYAGNPLFIDEVTTAVSAYALGQFLSVTDAGMINVGAPAHNHGTAGLATSGTASAAGLGHAFQTALNIVNTQTGLVYANMAGRSSATGGIIPAAELYLLGDILQACVNTSGTVATNSATANDGSNCGELFSFTAPPAGSVFNGVTNTFPTNTMQAMLNLVRYPNPSVTTTWNAAQSSPAANACTVSGASNTSGTNNSSTTCLFKLAAGVSAGYPAAIMAAPADWALTIVYPAGAGAQTTACTGTGGVTCPGIALPYYVTTDYQDNVYVLNYNASTPTQTNVIGFDNTGAPLMATPYSTADLLIKMIATDTAGHVIAPNPDTTSGSDEVKVYSTSTGGLLTTVAYNSAAASTATLATMSGVVIADAVNNVYVGSHNTGSNMRLMAYGGSSTAPTYTVSQPSALNFVPAPAGAYMQMAWDSRMDLYVFTSTPKIFYYANTAATPSNTVAPSLSGASGIATSTLSGGGGTSFTSTPSFGLGVTSAGTTALGATITADNVLSATTAGATFVTKSGTGNSATLSAGTAVSMPVVSTSATYRNVVVDGADTLYTVDGAGGNSQTGLILYDAVNATAFGPYRGCKITGTICGTTTGNWAVAGPRGLAIDSSGNVWVAAASAGQLTEYIGAAAPVWPGNSMGLTGRPQ